MSVEFRILGPFEVDGPAGPLVLRGRKRVGLLALLVAHAGEVISRDRIADCLWDEPDDGADRTIQTYLSQLRKLLDAETTLETVGRGYRLQTPRRCVDATRFIDLAEEANDADRLEDRRALLVEALGQWRGAPLEEFAGMAWADDFARRLEQRRLEVLEARIDVDLGLGRARELVGELEDLVRAYPLAEPLWAQLMLALYRCGRQADALRAYAALRSTLAEELGIEPSRALAELELRILDQDESLMTAVTGALPDHRLPEPSDLPLGTVTFLLTDIVESTEMWDAHPSEMGTAVREHESIIESVIAEHGGHLLKHRGEGDSTLSAFDRAIDALLAAISIRDSFEDERDVLTLPIRVRIALHTGEVEQRDRDYFGPTLNRAARIRALAGAGEILCSRATAELVADAVPASAALVELGSMRLRGLRRDEVVFRVVSRDWSSAVEPELRAVAGFVVGSPSADRSVRVELHDESTLIARDSEIDRLNELFASTHSGRPSVLFVRGDAGVGKTRLVSDFVDGLDGEVGVYFIPCSPQGSSARVALADLVRSASLADDANREIATLLGQPGARDGDGEAEAARLRRLTLLRDAIRALAAKHPAVLVVEDVHWAEPGLVELLEFVAQDLLQQRPARAPFLIITRRTFGVPAPVEAVLARLERLPRAKRLTLRPLREVDVDELVRSFGVDPPGRHLVRLLYDRSRGNPLYVREALRRIADLDAFVLRAGCIETRLPRTEFGAPADLRELVALRLADVPEEVLDALALASVAGFEFDPELVERVGGSRVADQLAVAIRLGLLAETGGGYRFTHPIIHTTVYDAVTPDRRRMHHRTLAKAIDRLPSDRRAERLLEFADHVLEGGVEDAPGYVTDDLEEAGRRAAALAEWGEAARCYDGALAIALRTRAPSERIGWLHYRSGVSHEQHYEGTIAEQRYWTALEIGRELENRELWGRAALALAMRTSVSHQNAAIGEFDERAADALAAALAHVGPDMACLRAELLCRYAEMRYQSGNVDDGLHAAAEAVSLAKADTGNDELLVICQSNLAYGHLAAGDASSALGTLLGARRGIETALGAQDQGFALARLALAYLALGRLDDALDVAHDAFVVFDAARHQSGACLAETIAADILLRRGERKEGERRGRAAAHLYRISQYSQSPAVLYSALVAARSADGDFDLAEQAIDEWTATGERGSGLARALLDVRSHKVTDPLALADRARRMMASSKARGILQIGRLGALAEIAAALDLADVARDVLDALEARASPDIVLSPGFPFHVLATRAVALKTLGSPETTAAYADAAAATTRVERASSPRREPSDTISEQGGHREGVPTDHETGV